MANNALSEGELLSTMDQKLSQTFVNVGGTISLYSGLPISIPQGVLLRRLLPPNHPVWELRETLFYKIEAIGFHVRQLKNLADHYSSRSVTEMMEFRKDPNNLRHVAQQHLFLFDDVIYSAASLMDNVGNLIGYIFYGDQRRKLKWKGAAESAGKQEGSKKYDQSQLILKGQIAPLIRKYNDELWKGLEQYRAEIYHYHGTDATAIQRINLMGKEISGVFVSVPDRYRKHMKTFSNTYPNSETAILVATVWTALKVTDAVNEMLFALQQDIMRLSGSNVFCWDKRDDRFSQKSETARAAPDSNS